MRLSKFLLHVSGTTHSAEQTADGGQNIVQNVYDDSIGSEQPIVDSKGEPIRCFKQHRGSTLWPLQPGYGNNNFYNEGQTNTPTITAVTSSLSAYVTGSLVTDYVFLLGSNYS